VRKALLSGVCPWYIRFLCTKEYWQAVGQADLVMSTGGHRVTTLLVPDAVFPATFDMAIALLRQKPLVLWSQSIGPLSFRQPENRKMIETILSRAWRILIRDEVSEEELSKIGVSMKNVSQTPESVLGLFDVVERPIKPCDRERVMGVSVYMSQKRSLEENEAYINSISALVDHAAQDGYSVRFFPMEMAEVDRPCIEQIIARCKNKEACSIVEGYPETVEHMTGVSQCRLFLGHKTHSVVFALTMGTPLIAIAYHQKTQDFMEQFGLGEYCVPEADTDSGKLIELFSKVSSNLDEISEIELKCSHEAGSRVREDFRRVIEDARRAFE
jgi:polysaccharide pyruvyl transferase WcaK-like protein